MSPNFKSLLGTNFEDLIIFDDLQFNGGFFLSNFGTKNDIFFRFFMIPREPVNAQKSTLYEIKGQDIGCIHLLMKYFMSR